MSLAPCAFLAVKYVGPHASPNNIIRNLYFPSMVVKVLLHVVSGIHLLL